MDKRIFLYQISLKKGERGGYFIIVKNVKQAQYRYFPGHLGLSRVGYLIFRYMR
jgi:hypothetical protein